MTPRDLAPFFRECRDHRPSRREAEVRGLLVVAGLLLAGAA